MNGLWKKRVPAFLLTLVMIVSLMPMALAEGEQGGENSPVTGPVDQNTCTHDWGGWVTTNSPTCSNEGVETQTCSICKKAETRSIAATGAHDYEQRSNTATCGAPGIIEERCKTCGKENTRTSLATGNHVDTNNDYICDVCGTVLHTHDFSNTWTTDATQHWHQCSCGEKKDIAGHIWSTDYKYGSDHSGQHWQECTVCGAVTGLANHVDVNPKNGQCDVCFTTVDITYTVTFNTNGGSAIASQQLKQGDRISVPSNPTKSGYTFKGWSLTNKTDPYNTGSSSPSLVDLNAQTVGTNNITYYAMYTVAADNRITSVNAATSIGTDLRNAINTQFQAYFPYQNFSTVYFSAPSANSYGTLYTDSAQNSKVNSGTYTYDQVSKMTFKADNGSYSMQYIAYYGNSTAENYVKGTVTIVTSTATGTVTYEVSAGKEVKFDSRDFNKGFQSAYGSSSRTLYCVVFTASTAYNSFRGQIYAGNTSFDRTSLNGSTFYYSSKNATGRNDYALDDLSFKADSNAKDGDSITIPFRAYYSTNTSSSNYIDCDLVIKIGKGGASGDINYDVAPGKSVDFKARDFRNFYDDNTTSGTFSYVEFSQPSSSAFNNGTLYHNYSTNSSKSFTRTTIANQKFYYNPSTSQYGIGDLTFVANNSFKDTITLDFTAYGSGRSVSGTVVIASTENSDDGDITYSVTPGKSVDFQRTAFNTYFRKTYNSTVSYVVFERPSSSTIFNNGTLYCDYGTNSQTSFSRSDLSGAKFYYNKNDMGRNDYYLDELTFVAGTGFKDSIKLNFTAYGERADEYVEGTLVIKADGAASITSNYTGGIRYATTTGTNVQINANDIARYFRKSYPTYNLQYVTLGGVPATGSLYYNYYNASSYGTTTRTQITSANCTGMTFYLSPTSTSQYALTELTYVPSGTSYCAGIPFTAYGTGGTVTGSILISVSRTAVSEVYGVTPRNTPVSFPAASIYSAVLTATGAALSGIQLLELPAATAGTVYIGTGNDRADTRTMYTYAAGANQMALLRFVPTAAYTGSVEIPYVALDANGNALATGTFALGVLNNRKTLTDVNASTWCYKYVMELTDQNVISGYTDGSFKPNSTVTYGAALKLIMLAAGYPEQAPTGKNVFSGYLSKAQADGIVTRSNVNLAAPITRLQVAQLAAGALKLSTSNLSSVKPFTDTSDVYVQALNAAGIVEGYFNNGTSTFRPSNTLTRGQMSAIVWRMNQYRK